MAILAAAALRISGADIDNGAPKLEMPSICRMDNLDILASITVLSAVLEALHIVQVSRGGASRKSSQTSNQRCSRQRMGLLLYEERTCVDGGRHVLSTGLANELNRTTTAIHCNTIHHKARSRHA